MQSKYDVIVVGMGPSSIFCAYELIQLKKYKHVLLIDQGKRVEDRCCPIEKTKKCIHCKPMCNITNGFSGAGAFSDGKLSLYDSKDDDLHVGGNLHKYIGVPKTKELIDYTDKIYLDFGADKKLEGTKYQEEIAKISERAEKDGVRLINIPIRHLGTEKSHEVYGRLEKYIEDEEYPLESVYADKVVLAVGRKGANWLVDMCNKHGIKTDTGIVDIGVRYELPDEIMKDVNKYMYEAKFVGRVGPFRDKVRTFCQNPSGFVSAEVYDNNLTLVNGHSYKERKSTNTNLAILVSHHFTHPFDKPIGYGRNVAQNLNDLGAGNIVVQRLGDIHRGKRTWDYELERNSVEPTLKSAVAGDITFALGYRTMVSILEFIRTIDKVVEGFANPDNLLYAPEIKFYSNKVIINEQFETNIKGLYSIGDGGGMTRGLMMASCSGIQMARNL